MVALRFLERENTFWDQVIFSDEATFELLPSKRSQKVYRRDGEEYETKNLVKTKKFGGGKLLVWGSISARGTGNLVFLSETINAGRYINILANNLFQSAEKMGLDAFTFQQDGASCHSARSTMSWLERKGVDVLDWAPQSPDMNPIEHVWAHIKRELANYAFNDLVEMRTSIQEIWDRIDPVMCYELVSSMPRRAQACYDARGGSTKY